MNWKRTIGWTFAGLGILLVVLLVGGYFYLHTNSFRRFAINEIEKQADQATGGRTHIGGIDLSLGNLTAHLYDITVHGTEQPGEAPLLHADELTVNLRIVSALHHKVDVKELLVDHPIVNVRVSRDGKNNLPTAPPKKESSQTDYFDLGIEHAQITNGQVVYNDRKMPLEADLYGLVTDVRFEAPAKRYVGSMSYQSGTLHYSSYQTLSHELQLKFTATPERFELKPVVLRVGSSEASLEAELSNYSNPVASGKYRVQIHTQDFASMSPSAQPAGDVVLSGNMQYQRSQSNSFIRDTTVDGQIASATLTALASGRRIDVNHLAGKYRLSGGNFALRDLKLETLGGVVTASAEMKHLDTTPESKVVAGLSGLSLGMLQRTSGQSIQQAKLSGTLRGQIEATWKGPVSNLRAKSDMFIRAQASSHANPSAPEVPLNGELHAVYDGPRQTVEVHNTTFTMPAAKLTAQGSLSDRSSLQVQAVASDLHQLVVLASSFASGQSAPPAVSGTATLNATVQGSMKRPKLTAQLDASNLAVEGSEWSKVTMTMHAAPSGVTIDRASLTNAHQGQISLNANVALKNWSYDESSPLQAQLSVRKIRLSELQALARQQYPVSGDLSATVHLQGSQIQPAGSGSAEILNARAYGESIQTLSAKFHADNGTIISTLQIAAPAGSINGDVQFTPKTKAYKVNITAPSVVLQNLQAVQQKNLAMSGTVSAKVTGEGTVDDPQLFATVELPQLQIRQNTISDTKAELRVAKHQAELTLGSQVSKATLRAHGRVNLTGEYDTDATLDTDTFPLDPLLATYAPSVPREFQGQTELHATLKGPLKDKSRVEAHLTVPVLKAAYRSLNVGIAHPIRVDYAQSVVTLQPAEITGTDTSLKAQGRIPIGSSGTPTLTADGSVNMAIAQIFAPTVQSSGNIGLNVRSSGKAINGQLQFHDVAVATPDAPVGVSKLNGNIDIANNRAQLSNLTAEVGGGPISLGGSVSYSPTVQFNLAVQGHGIRLRYPEGLRSLLDANLAFTGNTQASTLSGRVLIDNLSFTPDFDLASFSDQFSTGATVSQPGFADTIKLAMNVQSQQNINAVSSQVSIAGQVALQVGGTAANPVITGRTTLTSGELFFRNVRYQLQRGIITFDNPNETHPVLNVSVNTLIEQYNLTLTLRGPLDKLTTSYVSDPPLPTADIINLVARGKTTEEQAASSQSTDSMIASQVAGQLAGSVQKLAGISALEIDPTLGGNQNPSARIAIQQRVTKNLLFSFSTDVSQPGSEIVQGEYQINRRWSVTLQRDQLGGVAVDGRYHKRF